MTASKSSRARNARARANAARTGNTATGRADRNGPAGTAVSASAVAKTSAGRDGSTSRNGTSRNGASRNGASKGSVPSPAVAVNSGAPVRAGMRSPVGDESGAAAPARPAVPLWLQIVTFLLALAGLGVSIYLTIAHFTQSTLAGCSETSGLVDCTKVTTSAQSYVFGIPVAVLGLAFYLFMAAIMSPWAWRAARREIHLIRIASLVVGVGFVLYLLYAELFIIGNICLYCTSVHVITFVLFVLTMVAAAMWGLGSGSSRATARLRGPGIPPSYPADRHAP
jgi:uncharacterized membrane protein